MRFARLVTLAVLGFSSAITRAQVKAGGDAPMAVALYAASGLQNSHIVGDSSFDNATLTLGAYVALPRIRFEPGLDVRCLCGENGVQGTVAGPRFSTRVGPLRPYVEAVIGPAFVSPQYLVFQHGILTQGVVGLDFERSGFVHWRVVDVAFGSLSGSSGATPVTISTGIVVRFP